MEGGKYEFSFEKVGNARLRPFSVNMAKFNLFWYHVQTGKNTTIRHTAVRETGVSRHHGVTIEGFREPFEHQIILVLRDIAM